MNLSRLADDSAEEASSCVPFLVPCVFVSFVEGSALEVPLFEASSFEIPSLRWPPNMWPNSAMKAVTSRSISSLSAAESITKISGRFFLRDSFML